MREPSRVSERMSRGVTLGWIEQVTFLPNDLLSRKLQPFNIHHIVDFLTLYKFLLLTNCEKCVSHKENLNYNQ